MTTEPDFEQLYRDDPDPWQVGSSWYERRKLSIVTASLGRERYGRVWDVGCGTGHLARRLAEVATQVVATDAAAAAVRVAEQTCSGLRNVQIRRHRVPDQLLSPSGFDLIVLSEFLYYLDEPERRNTLELMTQAAASDAELAAVHWRHHPHDGYASGVDTQAEIVDHLRGTGWRHEVHHADRDFVLDILGRGTLEHE